jgi:hypothetical protein
MGTGVFGNRAFPVGDGGFEAFITEPTPASFNGQSGWWNVPQQWFAFTDGNGQIWVSPNPFPTPGATQPATVISGSSTVHFVPGPPVTNVTFIGNSPHGLILGNTVIISGAADSFLNGTFTVTNILSDSAFNYQITNRGGGTYSDPCTMQGPPVPIPQPTPRYAARVNMIGDGALIFIDLMRNLRTGDLNPYFRRNF